MSGQGSMDERVSDLPLSKAGEELTGKRMRRPTEKMKEYKEQMKKKEQPRQKNKIPMDNGDQSPLHRFNDSYTEWKTGMREARAKLQSRLSEEDLADLIEAVQLHNHNVSSSFERLQQQEVPNQITRMKMDGCTANTKNMLDLAYARLSEIDMEPWDDDAEQARLQALLDVEYAKSLYSLNSKAPSIMFSHSQTSSVSRKRAEAVAALAAKQAEMKALEEHRQERIRLQEELAHLDAEREVKVKQAIVDAYDRELGRIIQEEGNHGNDSPLNPRAKSFVPGNNAALNAIQESLDYSRLPPREPTTFAGDPLHFVKWKRSFQSLFGQRNIQASDKLALLERYVTGEAAECIDGMFYRTDEEAYNDAWKVLEQRFGHPSTTLNAFRAKLFAWPKIGAKDYTGLRKFADFLISLNHAMPHVQGLQHLNDEEENKNILRKLPDWLITKWGAKVAEYDAKFQPYPTFHVFVEFLATQARIATRPVCSLQALRGETLEGEMRPRGTRKVHMTTASRSGQQESINRNDRTQLRLSRSGQQESINQNDRIQLRAKDCPFCKSSQHYLPNCEQFLQKSLQERRAFIVNQKRCFKCLKTGHGSRNCRKPHQCQKCKGKHPLVLHDDNYIRRKTHGELSENEEAASSKKTYCGLNSSLSATSLTLPVWISCKENPNNEKLVYALIDSQSDTTFVDESLLRQLNSVSKQTTRLKVHTLTGDPKGMVCDKVSNLRVRGYNAKEFVDLPPAYSINHIPMQSDSVPTPSTARRWKHLKKIADKMPPVLDIEAGVLIGYDCSHAFLPRECITGADTEPFAIKTDLGWGIIGRTSSTPNREIAICNRITSQEIPLVSPTDAIRVLERDFQSDGPDRKIVSQEDLQFLKILENGIRKTDDGHFELPLPFKGHPQLPNNYNAAAKRLEHLKRKLTKNKELHSEYTKFMESTLADGHAEKVDGKDMDDGQKWYIPHHGVFHPQKKKLRVVFDCSARSSHTCLNDHLLTGPNLMGNLVGVLCRFRQHPIAVSCDIEKMFYQFKVKPEHRDYLRFLWWEQGDLTQEPSIFRMKVHLFGAASSPGCANYALKHIARECERSHPKGAKFIQEDFYMDDGLTSVPDIDTAKKTVDEAIQVCASGGARLHKFASNDKTVMESIPATEQATSSPLTLNKEDSAIQRTLGMQWSTEDDTLLFAFSPSSKPFTRRGVLSTVASLYDPLGLVAPFILIGKQILQTTCQKGSKWDEKMPTELLSQWQRWEQELKLLQQLSIPRCFYPASFNPVEFQLHHFCDASLKGYGMCTYLRSRNANGDVHCSLIAAKSRVTSSKVVSIPRLELTSALVAAEVGASVKESLTLKVSDEFFWSDSQVALGYINNEAKKFHIFVANRVQRIRELTKPSQWHYIISEENPADHCSRGLHAAELLQSNWLTGPNFLWEREVKIPTRPPSTLQLGDPEVRVVTTMKTVSAPACDLDSRLSHFSDWPSLLRTISRIRKLKTERKPSQYGSSHEAKPSQNDLLQAESAVIRGVQQQFFATEMSAIHKGKPLHTSSSIKHAEPFLQDGILRVGGRLTNHTSLSLGEQHPVILPKNAHITKLLIQHYHERARHQGRGMTMNELRAHGYWIVGGSRQVANLIKSCVTCRKLRGSVQEQQMAALPKERVEPSPPFTYVGMDVFGPFTVKNGRKEMKRYGLIFTCFSSRAIHVEMIDDLSTDAFINGMRCFLAIRGPVTELHSDQGTNFVGAANEFEAAFKEMERSKMEEFLAKNQCQFIFNAPNASHAGGVWERQIRTVRSVLSSTLSLSPNRLDDASLRTLFYEAMAIVNSRPLTAVIQGDPTAPAPLTPNHILTMKPKAPLPPPGNFVREDIYLRKRWRRVQYLVEQFWSRWKKEYLTVLTIRQKWQKPRRNLKVGDIVLISDSNTPRNQWSLARVVAALKGKDGLVRSVELCVATKELTNKGKRTAKPTVLIRPVQRLILLLAVEEQ